MTIASEILQQQVLPGEDVGGTDGFRGRYTDHLGAGLMNAETVAGITYAAIAHQQEASGVSNGTVVVAQDTRPHGERLRQATIAAALERGVEVVDLGVAPTPAAQKVASELGAMATFVLTASHNPADDNGLKYMAGWYKPPKEQVHAISERYWMQQEDGLVVPTIPNHEIAVQGDLLRTYETAVVEDIRRAFGAEKPLAGKFFVVDGANGAAMSLTPSIFRELGAQVETFACDGAGLINDGCGAAKLGGVKEFLRQRPDIAAHPGFVGAVANDGDADRIMAVGIDADGMPVEVNGNHMLWALAKSPLQPGIVGTEYTNSGLLPWLRKWGVAYDDCANGDVHVTNALLKRQEYGDNWTRGGEFTGHIVDTTWLNSGDGVHKAAWLAAWAATNGATFGDIHREVPLWREQMRWVDFPAPARRAIRQHPEVVAELARLDGELGADGRFIVRPSGTEPGVRIWCESRNAQQISAAVDGLAGVVASVAELG